MLMLTCGFDQNDVALTIMVMMTMTTIMLSRMIMMMTMMMTMMMMMVSGVSIWFSTGQSPIILRWEKANG